MDNDLTIHRMIERHTTNHPEHIAIMDAAVSYTYDELNKQANQLAHYLLSLGVKPDTLVAIALDRSPSLLISLVAILKAGGAYLPIDAHHPQDRLHYILETSQAPILLTTTSAATYFANYKGQVICLDEQAEQIKQQPSDNPVTSVTQTNLIYSIYTSGSTGKPKGVLLEHQSVVNYSQWFREFSHCRPQARIDFSSAIIFDMAVTTTITALALGLQIVICADDIKKNPVRYLQYLKKYHLNHIKLTPSYFKVLVEAAQALKISLPALKNIVLGGELLQTKTCREWLALHPDHALINEYGPTETTVGVTEFTVTRHNVDQLLDVVPIGKPGRYIHCQLLNEKQQSIVNNEVGELYIGGTCLARGYLNQPALTAQQFIDYQSRRLYKTGDLCQRLSDGNLIFINRIDEQVKIRGYRIELGEIEACLRKQAQMKDVKVIARETGAGEKKLVAYYVLSDPKHAPTLETLRLSLQQQLVEYMIPSAFVMLQSFPQTENGKLDIKALPEPNDEHHLEASSNEIESQLMSIWRKVFHVSHVGVNSHFIELGGHSLIAARMIIEIEQSLGKRISLEDLYKAPTIKQLAPIVAAADSSDASDIMEINHADKKAIPLSDFQFLFWISRLFEPKVVEQNIVAKRRVAGVLAIDALTAALNWVLERHEVLLYQIEKLLPMLHVGKYKATSIIEIDLSNATDEEVETQLLASYDELVRYHTWTKEQPMLILKLFHLPRQLSELQLCTSHIIFDDASEEIFFKDLSDAYLHYTQRAALPALNGEPQYKDYVWYEREHLNQYIERDIDFWHDYLQEVTLLNLPTTEIIRDMQAEPYSTYLPLSDHVLDHIRQHCVESRISMTDWLSACVTLGLKKMTGEFNHTIYINMIRSVRQDEIQDKMIGCFLRLDPVKVDLHATLTVMETAQAIQQARIKTDPYQSCSGMLKLACLDQTYREPSGKNALIRLISVLFSKLFYKAKLSPKLLMMYGHLLGLRTDNQFLVNINFLNNFVLKQSPQTLFGLTLEKSAPYDVDISNINNVLDVCFLKDSDEVPYLVISGNLQSAYRAQIGHAIIQFIAPLVDSDSASVTQSQKQIFEQE